jgi:hypothetical protein
MNTSKNAERLIVALVRFFDNHPAELTEPGFGLDVWDLAVQASLISKDDADTRRQNFSGGAMDDLPHALHLLIERGWAQTSEIGAYGKYSKALFPTSTGIDYAHKLMRPWYIKLLDFFKDPIRTIITAILTSFITTLITYFILKLLGQ